MVSVYLARKRKLYIFLKCKRCLRGHLHSFCLASLRTRVCCIPILLLTLFCDPLSLFYVECKSNSEIFLWPIIHANCFYLVEFHKFVRKFLEMAELNVGEQCSFPSCQRLDFLPLQCKGCGKIFCKEHNATEIHQCPEKEEKKKVSVSGPTSFPCGIEGCKEATLVPLYCDACERSVCIKHKQKELHDCPYLKEFEETRKNWKSNKLSAPVLASKTSAPKKPLSGKQAKMAAKVQLMKLKMKAKGDDSVAMAERVYFLLTSSDSSSELPVFFRRKLPFGKVIDYGAKHLNLSFSDASKKLCATSLCGATPDPSSSIDDCLNDCSLLDGDTLSFHFV